MLLYQKFAIVVLLFIVFSIHDSVGKLSNELTPNEIQALEKLKPLVIKDLYKEYMKNDHYLVRFLRARKLNVNDAKEMLLQSISWRQRNKIDTILEESLEIEKYLSYTITSDREGRPVGINRVVDLNIRRTLLANGYSNLVRFIYKLWEMSMVLIINADAAHPGKNITQGALILDFAGFSVREHSCSLCFRFYFHILGVYEQNYPLLLGKLIALNVPRLLETSITVFKSVLSEESINALAAYGYDKQEGRKALLEIVSDDKLPPSLGGTYVEPSYIRKTFKLQP